eukprot:UN26993
MVMVYSYNLFGLYSIVFDISSGLNNSNSSLVSFVHSFDICHSFMTYRQTHYDPKHTTGRFLTTLAHKYFGSTCISLLLGVLPVYLRGTRHIISFAFAFYLAESQRISQYADLLLIKLIIKLCVALHKLRKILF